MSSGLHREACETFFPGASARGWLQALAAALRPTPGAAVALEAEAEA